MLRNLRTSKLLLIAATTSLLPITTLKPSNCDYYQERPGVEDTFIPDASTTKGHHTFHSYKRRRAPTFEERKMRKEMSKEMIFTGVILFILNSIYFILLTYFFFYFFFLISF